MFSDVFRLDDNESKIVPFTSVNYGFLAVHWYCIDYVFFTKIRSRPVLKNPRVRTEEQLVDALTGRVQPMHREMLALQLRRLQLIDQQIAQLTA